MKMKLLDYALLCALAGMASAAQAQEAVATAPTSDAGAAQADCDAQGCNSDDGMLFKLISRGKKETLVPQADPTSSVQLAPDRRVSVEQRRSTATGSRICSQGRPSPSASGRCSWPMAV